ncbi:MMPL family transporter [Priestia endophytica]|uniref:MMPL family transporter n=1 Tax=Priestia endophytica TaxID=135735 RepID=UPI000F52442C|nr:MMPL family transporter [Priestia endophytica]RPK12920.1 hypothetical protein FH5_03126 [Priestia endophytica]
MNHFMKKLISGIVGKKGRWITLIVWVLLIGVLQMVLPSSSTYTDDSVEPLPSSEPSMKAANIVEEKFPNSDGVPALLTWYNKDGISEKELTTIASLSKELNENKLPHQEMAVPYDKMPMPALKELVSEDGTTFIQTILFEKGASSDELKEGLTELETHVDREFEGNPLNEKMTSDSLVARVTGPAGISVDATGLFKNADVSLLIGTVLLVLVFLLLIYRSPILPFVPLIAVGAAYAVATPILGALAKAGYISYDSQGISIMTVLLFGAGTDYCLFLISRFRLFLYEEGSRLQALKRAFLDTSGAIGVSGLTVVSALLALLVSKYATIHNFAIPFSLSIFIMMISSLTLVPALLSILGRSAFFPFVPRTEDMEKERAQKKNKKVKLHKQSRFWYKVGAYSANKPVRTVIITLLFLIVSSTFVTGIKYSYDMLSAFPKDTPSREGFDLISDGFGAGDLAPLTVVFEQNGENENIKNDLARLDGISRVENPETSQSDQNFVSYKVELEQNPYSNEAMDDVEQLRKNLKELSDDKRFENVWVSGQTAEQLDQRTVIAHDETKIISFVIVVVALLLLLYLRSIVAMVYLIATVLISFTSALGLGWVILHYGFDVGAISGLIPIYAFVFIVALGEDYNIFMISNIWEKKKELPLKEAIKEGVGQSGGVITSAGIILAGTFAVLTTLPIQVLVQFGLITAIGVLLDTFIVRPLLVPAITSLLGKWAFWPSKLGKVKVREED